MGTRGFLGFVNNDIEKITYNHFDSYPSGVGVDVLAELHELTADLDSLRERVTGLVVVDEQTKPTADELAKVREFTDSSVSTGDDWYSALRKTQGSLAATLRAGYMTDSGNFPLDSLFCEWGYLVNLDDQTFEVYRGFNKALPAAGRWANRPTPEEDAASYQSHVDWCAANDREPWQSEVSEYKAVTLMAVWPLHDLPDEAAFLAETEQIAYAE